MEKKIKTGLYGNAEELFAAKFVITKQRFKKLLEGNLGGFYPRAEKLFIDFGPILSFDFTIILLFTVAEKKEKIRKIRKVLDLLEENLKSDLSYKPPEARGSTSGIDDTGEVFKKIYNKILGLKTLQLQRIG